MAATETDPYALPVDNRRDNATIALYIGGLGLTWGMTGLASIPVQFFLKDRLHLSAPDLAQYAFIVNIPNYVGFLFGFVRDRWQPLKRGDRGYFLVFAPLLAILYAGLSGGHLTYERLLGTILLAHVVRQLLTSSYKGLMASVAQSRMMPGRLSVLSTLMGGISDVLVPLCSGWLTGILPAQKIFLIVALLFLVLMLFGFWKPASVYGGEEPSGYRHDNQNSSSLTDTSTGSEAWHRERGNFWGEVGRLVRHRPLWPVAAIAFLGNFMPGFTTPLLFYLTNTLHLDANQYGQFTAVLQFSFAPSMVLHGLLCRRVSMSRLLPISMLIMLPQVVPLLFIHTPAQAMFCAVLMGVTGGMAVVTILDATMRACPKGLEGTGMMLLASALTFSSALSDVVGAWLYDKGGFSWCVIATTLAYALIFPLIPLIPKSVLASRDGEITPLKTN